MDEYHKRVVQVSWTPPKIDTLWYHLQEVLEQAKRIYGEINQNGSYPWNVQGETTRNGPERTFWDDGNILYLDRSYKVTYFP